MTIFGYARVSTDGQTLDAQVAALKRAGAARVFHEKVSGAKTARRELARLLVITGSRARLSARTSAHMFAWWSAVVSDLLPSLSALLLG